MPKLNTRKPTGQVPWPLILLEGPEKAGKSLIPVVLSRSERVGMTYWLDLGEGAADEYAALPGADYEVIEHDGSYRAILEQVTAVWEEAKRAQDAGEAPVVIVVDSMSALWSSLVNWTNDRARRSRTGQRKLADDPDAEVDPTSNLWNDANKRHARVMELLMTFPGVAIVTARGKEVAAIGPNGQPIEGRKEWKVEGQKNLAYDVSAWVRLSRDPREAKLIGARSLRIEVPKNRPAPMPMTQVGSWEVVDLETFIFDTLGCTGTTQTRDLQRLRGDDLEGIFDKIAAADDEKVLRDLWSEVEGGCSPAQRQELSNAITAALERVRGAAEGIETTGPTGDAAKLRQAADKAAAADEDAA